MSRLDTRRIVIFLLIAFGLAWADGLVIYQTGGLADSPELIPGTGITLALVLLATIYMWAPAVAHIVTRWVTGEGWQDSYLKPHFKRGWPYWLVGWFAPALLTILGAGLFFALFPHTFDPELTQLAALLPQAEGFESPNLWLIVLAQAGVGILAAPLINGLFTFGEEFGWRAYLQPKLMPLGLRPMFLVMGLIWGVWHWPVIAMGHNYGLDYPGAPWLGMLAMLWFTFLTGTFLGWITWRGGSVWPAVIGHGALNGIASLGILFVRGQPNPLLGPLPVGVIASLPWLLGVGWIWLDPKARATSPPPVETVSA